MYRTNISYTFIYSIYILYIMQTQENTVKETKNGVIQHICKHCNHSVDIKNDAVRIDAEGNRNHAYCYMMGVRS